MVFKALNYNESAFGMNKIKLIQFKRALEVKKTVFTAIPY